MAYAATNPPAMIGQRIGGGGALWIYQSTDPHADVDGTDYFSNGSALGMQVGDVVVVVDTDGSYALSLHAVTGVTAGGAATAGARVTA